MDAAENKYKTRLLTGEWGAPTKEQEQILALTAQVDKLRIAATPKKDKQKNGQSNAFNPQKKPLHVAGPKPLHVAGPKPLHAATLTY
jgi:hypothetical protein